MLLRRTRLGLLAARELAPAAGGGSRPGRGGSGGGERAGERSGRWSRPAGPVARVAEVMARELGWDRARVELELERFAAEAEAEGMLGERSHEGTGEPRVALPADIAP